MRRGWITGVLAASLALSGAPSAWGQDFDLTGFGRPVVDGRFTPDEWKGAGRVTYQVAVPVAQGGGTVPMTWFVMNDATDLYVAVRIARRLEWDGLDVVLGSDIIAFWTRQRVASYPPAGFSDLFASGTCWCLDTSAGGASDGSGAAAFSDGFSTYELSHPLDSADDAHDVSLGPGAILPVNLDFAAEKEGCASTTDCFSAAQRFLARIRIAAGSPSLALESARVDARWRQSELQGGITVTGTTGDGGDLTLTLAPVTPNGAQPLVQAIQVVPGRFTQVLELPATGLLPGRYTLRVSGASNGVPLAEQTRTITLPAPPEGVVREATFRGSQSGAPVTSLPSGSTGIWVSFHFAVMPKRTLCKTTSIVVGVTVVRGKKRVKRKVVKTCTAPVAVAWYRPGDPAPFVVVQKRDTPVIGSFYQGPTALLPGAWRVVLSVGGRVTKEATIQVA
jgi:hypothetical protein